MHPEQIDDPAFPLGPFVPLAENPIMRPSAAPHEATNVYNPAAIVRNEQVCLLYRAHGADLVSRICLAQSSDGIHFVRRPEPVLFPTEAYESRGCEDPRVAEVEGTYYLTYTAYDGEVALLCLATSTDLVCWEKHGPLFPEFNTYALAKAPPRSMRRVPSTWSKAGAILATPINGRYLMYFGEGWVYYAWSEDLIHWVPGPESAPVLSPEPGTFMADLVEVGPQPVITANGLILLVHNAAVYHNDGSVTYSCGQALFSPEDPGAVVAKMVQPWLGPQTYEEHHGLVPHVTFVEGLVNFGGSWIAYYGQSDTTIGAAVSPAGVRYGRTERTASDLEVTKA